MAVMGSTVKAWPMPARPRRVPFTPSVAANVIKVDILKDQKNLIVLGEMPCDNSKSQNVLRR